MNFTAIFAIITAAVFVGTFFIWLFFGHGLDKIRNPGEWKSIGGAGERTVFLTLRNKFHVPDNQILRNVYIPTIGGGTSEIDILVVSKKGLLVFECKNYGGNIYGDINKGQWLQYIGKEKYHFYNPFLQNRTHVKHLKNYLGEEFGDLPIIPFVVTIVRGKWKVRNLGPDDYLLGYNCKFEDIYEKLEDSELMAKNFKKILRKLTPLERPGEDIRQKHVDSIVGKK